MELDLIQYPHKYLEEVQKNSIMSNSFSWLPPLLFFFIFCSVESSVLQPRTFKYVNQGDLQSGSVEYNATYRPLKISNHPFHLCFYNTTPNTFILSLGMGNANDNSSVLRWVWTANPARPVSENATLVFNRGGNLALVDIDGRVAWQTRTTNQGVVNIKLLPNGNLVLVDKNGSFVWQSFHYPTNTLLVGQGLGPGISSTNKLVNGAYSMVLEGEKLVMKFKSPQSPKPVIYWNEGKYLNVENSMTFNSGGVPGSKDYTQVYFSGNSYGNIGYLQVKFNSTLSLFRLGPDGNFHIYTYYYKNGTKDVVWEEIYTRFSDNPYYNECRMPEKCGSLGGICVSTKCVACPTPKGFKSWSEDRNCKSSKLPSCNVSPGNVNVNVNVSYYKIEEVDHVMSVGTDGEGPMEIDECRKKCSDDCKCVAFFHQKYSKSCWITTQLYTMMKYPYEFDSAPDGYIKYAN